MSERLTKYVAVTCILLHVGMFFLSEFGHSHPVPGPHGVASLATHECTTVERHLPIDGHPQCLLCTRYVPAIVTVAETTDPVTHGSEVIAATMLDGVPQSVYYTSVSHRGPPSLLG